MKLRVNRPRIAFVLLSLPIAWACQAGEHHGAPQESWPKAYVQECAACHIPYAPQLLPAASWARLMGRLDRHFGTNATLDERELQQLSAWLQAGADRRLAAAPVPEDRITRTARFERKHRQIEPATWRLPSVRSPANCMACHGGAEQGRFSEHELRMPAGLSARQRAAWDD